MDLTRVDETMVTERYRTENAKWKEHTRAKMICEAMAEIEIEIRKDRIETERNIEEFVDDLVANNIDIYYCWDDVPEGADEDTYYCSEWGWSWLDEPGDWLYMLERVWNKLEIEERFSVEEQILMHHFAEQAMDRVHKEDL